MWHSILEQVFMALPLILGAYFTLSLLKLPDLGLESAYLFGAVAAFLAKDLPLPLILLSSCLGGAFSGLVLCACNKLGHVPFLLAAIITNGLFHGLTQYALGTSTVSFLLPLPFSELYFFGIVSLAILTLSFFFLRSELGFSLTIYGNNPHFFASYQLSGNYVLVWGVLLAHGLAGISGFFFAQSSGFVDLNMNFGLFLLCLTALMMGKFIISWRASYPDILIPLMGIVAYYFIQQLLLRLGLNLKYFNAFQALFVLAILLVGKRKRSMTLDHLGV